MKLAKTTKKKNIFRRLVAGITAAMATTTLMMPSAFADTSTGTGSSEAGSFSNKVGIADTSNVSADNLMGSVIGIILTITRFVGIALLIYGVYETVMSFMQNQPEQKTKGIIMLLAGVVLIVLKSILKDVLHVIS